MILMGCDGFFLNKKKGNIKCGDLNLAAFLDSIAYAYVNFLDKANNFSSFIPIEFVQLLVLIAVAF